MGLVNMNDINNMTEKEIRSRMKEIDKIREELKNEKAEYENYFNQKRLEQELEDRLKFIGKCFVSNYNCVQDNNNKWLRAFKIVDILEEPNSRYANCIALISGYRNTAWSEYGIQVMTLPLWCSNNNRIMSSNEPNLIEYYEEISNEEFKEMVEKYKDNLFKDYN